MWIVPIIVGLACIVLAGNIYLSHSRCQIFRDAVDGGQHLEALQFLHSRIPIRPNNLCEGPVQAYIRTLAEPSRDPEMFGELIKIATNEEHLQSMILETTINSRTSDDTIATLYRKYSSRRIGPKLVKSVTKRCEQISIERCEDLRNKLDGTRLFDPLTRTLIQHIPSLIQYIPMFHAELDRRPELMHQVLGKCVEGTFDFCQVLVNDTTNATFYDLILIHAIERRSVSHTCWALERGAQFQIAITDHNVEFVEEVNHPMFTSAIQTYHQLKRAEVQKDVLTLIAAIIHATLNADDDDCGISIFS